MRVCVRPVDIIGHVDFQVGVSSVVVPSGSRWVIMGALTLSFILNLYFDLRLQLLDGHLHVGGLATLH